MTALLQWITPSHFRGLLKEGISLDMVYLLAVLKSGGNLSQFSTRKEQALIQALERRFLITEDRKLTIDGERVFRFIEHPLDQEILKSQNTDDKFELFWKAYPNTDSVIKDSKVMMKGTRSLKAGKTEAAQLFRQILGEGEFTAEQIIQALNYEVSAKIEQSLKLNENKMRYMQNSSTWLRQRTFVQFVELSQLSTQAQTKSGTVDI
jgi:hypothetical protein